MADKRAGLAAIRSADRALENGAQEVERVADSDGSGSGREPVGLPLLDRLDADRPELEGAQRRRDVMVVEPRAPSPRRRETSRSKRSASPLRLKLRDRFRSASRYRTTHFAPLRCTLTTPPILVDAFNDRAAALDCLAGIAQAEPQSASEVFLIAQDDDGNTVGETMYASSVSVPA